MCRGLCERRSQQEAGAAGAALFRCQGQHGLGSQAQSACVLVGAEGQRPSREQVSKLLFVETASTPVFF